MQDVGPIDKITNERPNGQDSFDKFSVIHIYFLKQWFDHNSIGQTGKQKKNLCKYQRSFAVPILLNYNSTSHKVYSCHHRLSYSSTFRVIGYDLSILGKIRIVQEDDVYKNYVTSKVLQDMNSTELKNLNPVTITIQSHIMKQTNSPQAMHLIYCLVLRFLPNS